MGSIHSDWTTAEIHEQSNWSKWTSNTRVDLVRSQEQRQAQAPEEHGGETEEIDLTPHGDPDLKASRR